MLVDKNGVAVGVKECNAFRPFPAWFGGFCQFNALRNQLRLDLSDIGKTVQVPGVLIPTRIKFESLLLRGGTRLLPRIDGEPSPCNVDTFRVSERQAIKS